MHSEPRPVDIAKLGHRVIARSTSFSQTFGGESFSSENGINEEMIAELIGRERTMGAFVNWGADHIAPGHVRGMGEVDWIVAVTVRKGEELGLSLPLNRRLVELIHELEEGKRPMDIRNFQALGVEVPR